MHMAADFLRVHPQSRVCVVDADVEKGDVAAVLDIRQSVSIADIAKVYSDLSANTVGDAVIQHESGIHVMLAPVDVRESDYITPEAIHAILDLLRMEFPLVIVDAGGHVSPSQAAIAQMADEMVVVTSPDAWSCEPSASGLRPGSPWECVTRRSSRLSSTRSTRGRSSQLPQ
ncbi:hypothetical protein JCM18909_1043 [Cutibacterium acnes JCM 18909]|nr:hypothetical protein JCM18909_1043 [Cutibacterium acnes JCM 18909]